MMAVLILAQLTSGTGNRATAERVRSHIETLGIPCFLKCPSQLVDKGSINIFIKDNAVKFILGIHAYRAGTQLKEVSCPFCIIFGGTDLNECYKVEAKMKVMSHVTNHCQYAVAFNKPMMKKAVSLWPGLADKIVLIPQGVEVSPSSLSWRQFLDLQRASPIIPVRCGKMVIFLLVSGLRRVKDPLFLTKVVSDWHMEDNTVHMYIVGPKLDEDFSRRCIQEIEKLPGVTILPVCERQDLHALMRDANAVINSSISEGMPSALIEAMKLGTPVIARRNEGCADLVRHRETGLLFDTPEEFKLLAKELLESDTLCKQLVAQAMDYVDKRHDIGSEREVYKKITRLMCSTC